MAAKGLQIDYEPFCCSVCLDLLKDPVTIPCGHSYCMSCVNTHWDGEVGKQSYSCPQCRQNFTQRPVLVKNTMLAVLMEGLKKSAPPAAPLPPSAAPGEVFCDLCSGREVKAVKSCLQCQVSYCKEHLQPHYDVAALKKHKLVEPTENLQENMCSRHDEVMKMFCRTDQQCICYLCSVDQHKGHHTVTAAAERAEKQRELQAFQQNILQKIKLKQENLGSLQHQLKNNSRSADAAMELCDRSLKDLLQLLEKRMREVRQQVRSQQEAEEHRVNELQDKVQQELTELRRKLTELDTLSQTEDHVTFLHKFPSLSKFRETSESVKSSQTPPPFKDTVTAAVSKLRSTLEETILIDPTAVVHKPKVNTAKTDALPAAAQKLTLSTQGAPTPPLQTPGKTSAAVQKTKVNTLRTDALPARTQGTAPSQQSSSENIPVLTVPNLNQQPTASVSHLPQPVVNLPQQPSDSVNFDLSNLDDLELADLLRYSRRITFDPHSLNYKLHLSKGDTVVRRLSHEQKYPPHPDRFLHIPQVVTKENLTGRCFWQVLANYEDGFAVAVSYRSITRAAPYSHFGNESEFGQNPVSWLLECYSDHFDFYHKSEYHGYIRYEGSEYYPSPTKIGIFLDHEAGVLAFYKIFEEDDTVMLLHTVNTTFTQPLVAGIVLQDINSTAELL